MYSSSRWLSYITSGEAITLSACMGRTSNTSTFCPKPIASHLYSGPPDIIHYFLLSCVTQLTYKKKQGGKMEKGLKILWHRLFQRWKRQKDCKILHDGTGHLLLILYAVCAHVRKNVTARKTGKDWQLGGGGGRGRAALTQKFLGLLSVIYALKFSNDRSWPSVLSHFMETFLFDSIFVLLCLTPSMLI